jgi:hypothetical protein
LLWSQLGSADCSTAVAIDNDDIGGVVTDRAVGSRRLGDRRDKGSAHRYAKMVVTDDQGRPSCRSAERQVQIWVRGYGLVDSQKVDAEPVSSSTSLP